ncbi:MAG: circadian clock protein KaiC [Pleurocapsa minor GSE-CHR-MK-17-07R]|nr:circadian clock protein KaiC [Pleurocapsa minor GSE-CHR-MK 17-07R]
MTDQFPATQRTLEKSPTGISGFDEISGGGLPKGRPSLICGGAGCGKTLFSMEFLVNGIRQYDEPGVFMAFEETREDLTKNTSSLGFELDALVQQGKLIVDHVSIERSELEQAGDYDLDGLFVRLGYAIKKVGAKRVVLDTIEVLFNALGDSQILRAELRRLFTWLKSQGVTAIITGERGDGTLTRYGVEEYVSDCVILLDHRVENQMSIRRVRIVKYRGSTHGTDEYPFLIDETGFSVLPVTSVGLNYPVSAERISSGIPRLDAMLDGKGFYRASTIMVSGTGGSGKSTLAAHFVDAAAGRGEKCLYFSFEESPSQIIRNMSSIGIDLQQWVDAGLLQFRNVRPTMYSMEMHLAVLHKAIREYNPQVVIMDPITNFNNISNTNESRALITRLIDFLKSRGITALFTSLTSAGEAAEQSGIEISSIVDAWLLVRNVEFNGERNRVMYILKARGMAHSNQVCEFQITNNGIQLVDAYLGSAGVLTGSARLAQEARERDEELAMQQRLELQQLQLERKRLSIEAQIAALQSELEVERSEIQLLLDQDRRRRQSAEQFTNSMMAMRNMTIEGVNTTSSHEQTEGASS